MQTGVYVEYDSHFRFMAKGDDWTYQLLESMLPLYSDRMVIGMDMAKNTYWKSYGGKPGLNYLLTEFRQELETRGIGDYFQKLFFTNPQHLYSFKND
jgi:phosphotriesterase-related protein